MSLKQLFAADITAYAQAVAVNSVNPPNGVGSFSGLATIAGSTSNTDGRLVHHRPTDRYYAFMFVRSAGESVDGYCFFDPAFQAFGGGDSNYINQSTFGANGSFQRLTLDQVNEQTNTQRIFTTDASQNVFELTPISLTESVVFDGPNGRHRESIGGLSGFAWTASAQQNLYFTGLTDGLPLETLNQGSNIYPDGLFLAGQCSGQVNSINFANRFAWIDIRTRNCVGLLGATDIPAGNTTPIGFPQKVQSTIVENSEAPIGGDSFDWQATQYIPDGDATFAAPKGRLMFLSRTEIPFISNPTGGEQARIYIRLTDFNPFNLTAAVGQPERVHGRIRLTTRVLADVAPPFGVAGQDFPQNPGNNQSIIFDVLRNRFVMMMQDTQGLSVPFPPDAAAQSGYCTYAHFSLQPELAFLTNPAAVDVPRTNDIVEFQSRAVGDLAEPISGQDVDWTLTRRSTQNEVLTISGGIGTTSTVANAPIDIDGMGSPEGSLVVVADGIELAETTDYTVVLATGVITWVTDQQGATLVTASYEHRQTAATPPHGTLISSTTQSDGDGIAATRVQYADDDSIVGQLDYLEVAES